MVGMTRESINKQLRAWAAREWVRLEHGVIVVLKAEPLQSTGRSRVRRRRRIAADGSRALAGSIRRISQKSEHAQGVKQFTRDVCARR